MVIDTAQDDIAETDFLAINKHFVDIVKTCIIDHSHLQEIILMTAYNDEVVVIWSYHL